jgi:NADPH:quinone reductase-like Zn-dependent oxidoreductase
MRAVMFQAYGPPEVLTPVDLPTPVPRGDQVQVQVHTTTVTSAECGMRRGEPRWGRLILGPRRPRKGVRVLGLEFAGRVTALGPAARRYEIGDRVFGFTGFGIGANAEYNCLSKRASLTTMPPNVSHAQAAASVDGFTTAWYFLRELARVRKGQRVLVIGGSGSIGTYAVQLASRTGAVVHAVCSGRNAKLVESLGAERVYDYTVEDFTAGGERYDVVFDTVGRSSFAQCRAVLAPRGCYLPTTGLVNNVLACVPRSPADRGYAPECRCASTRPWPSCATCSHRTRSASSSTAATRWPSSPRRTGTSTAATRPATSSSPSPEPELAAGSGSAPWPVG